MTCTWQAVPFGAESTGTFSALPFRFSLARAERGADVGGGGVLRARSPEPQGSGSAGAAYDLAARGARALEHGQAEVEIRDGDVALAVRRPPIAVQAPPPASFGE